MIVSFQGFDSCRLLATIGIFMFKWWCLNSKERFMFKWIFHVERGIMIFPVFLLMQTFGWKEVWQRARTSALCQNNSHHNACMNQVVWKAQPALSQGLFMQNVSKLFLKKWRVFLKKAWNICSTYWMNILKPFWNIGKRSAVFIFKCVFKFKGIFVWTSLCSTSSLSISYGQVRASPVFSSAQALTAFRSNPPGDFND